MSDQPEGHGVNLGGDEPQTAPTSEKAARAGSQIEGALKGPGASEDAPVKKLTEEEQMALYENDLKNSDWGHQPC